jgi:rhamnosyltransferase subunit B
MHALLVSLGSDGDVFPFVGVGIRLRARGHRVTLAANEHYGKLAAECGFEFRALASDAEMDGLLGNRDVWHPIKSALVGARWSRAGFARQYEVIAEAAREPGTVIVAYPPMFAARVTQEKLRCPLVSLVPMPWMILSDAAPPALPGAARYRWLQGSRAARIGWRLGEGLTDFLLGPHLNRLRRSLGLNPVRGIYRWCFSRELTIGLFPEWYAPPQADWPVNTRLGGFSMYDGAKAKHLPEELLEFCRSGSRPVAFTFGTAMRHGRELFHAALECCEALKMRGIFLTRFSGQMPDPLPHSVRHCVYAPFGQLFPQCAAVVHHGGAGTTARALGAGLPQLIVPLAWDQPDNAMRVKNLGAGDWIRPPSSGREMAEALAKVMTSERQARCHELARRFEEIDGSEKAAEWVDRLTPGAETMSR